MSYLRCGSKLPSGKKSRVYVYGQVSNPGTLMIISGCAGMGENTGMAVITIEEFLYIAKRLAKEMKNEERT